MSSLIDIAQNICDNINSRVKSQQDGRGKIFYKPITSYVYYIPNRDVRCNYRRGG